MLYLLLGIAAFGLAQEEFKALNARANYSEPLDSLLLPRELTGRQQYCDAGYGLCDSGSCCPSQAGCCGSGCINRQNTCCDGRVCPPSSGCCGSGYCRPEQYLCCGSAGDIHPVGTQCCSDGNYCPGGSTCVTCRSGSGICCRGASGDYIDPTIQTSVADVTYPPDSQTASNSLSDSLSTSYSTTYEVSYSSYTYTYHSYFYTTYTYWFITWIPLYTPTTSRTVTTTTTLSAYATDSAEASSSFSVDVASIQSDVSFSSSLYSPETLAPSVTLSTVSGAANGGSASGSSSGAASAQTNLVAAIFGLMSLAVGVLAVML